MGRYWERGNRDEWNALSRKHKREKTPAQVAIGNAAIAQAKRELAATIAEDALAEVPRETCAELGHAWRDSETLLHTLQCARCNVLIENPKRMEALRRNDTT